MKFVSLGNKGRGFLSGFDTGSHEIDCSRTTQCDFQLKLHLKTVGKSYYRLVLIWLEHKHYN